MLLSVLLFVGLPLLAGTLIIFVLYKIAQMLTSFFTKGVTLALAISFGMFALGIVDGDVLQGSEFLREAVGALGANVVPLLIDGFVALLELVV